MSKLKSILSNPWLLLVARIIVGALFVMAAIPKITDTAMFAKQIDNYQLLSGSLVWAMAVIMPWVELVCGILLIVGVRLKSNATISILMYLMFQVAISWGIWLGTNLDDCGCHVPVMTEEISFRKLAENMIPLLLSVWLFFYPAGRFGLESLAIKAARENGELTT